MTQPSLNLATRNPARDASTNLPSMSDQPLTKQADKPALDEVFADIVRGPAFAREGNETSLTGTVTDQRKSPPPPADIPQSQFERMSEPLDFPEAHIWFVKNLHEAGEDRGSISILFEAEYGGGGGFHGIHAMVTDTGNALKCRHGIVGGGDCDIAEDK